MSQLRLQTIIKAIVIVLTLSLMSTQIDALDYPHSGINNIGCDSCHFVYGEEPSLLPPWTEHVPQDIDDTQFNTLCWSCHNDIEAPYMKTHSSLQTDNSYGDWTIECRTCHDPHAQQQIRAFGNASHIYSGASTAITATTLSEAGAGWTANEFQGLILIPNAERVTRYQYSYKITGNTGDTITVSGPIDLTRVSVGDTFAVIYGKLVKSTIVLDNIINPTPPKTGSKTTRFFNNTGANSFADSDPVSHDGVCEVCHTHTTHFRNDGGGSDQWHTNMGSPAGTNCTKCHQHVNGFSGMGDGAHRTHVIESMGPQLSCPDCHGSNSPPVLGDGQDLSNTTVCNNCHSADGVPTARTYWHEDPGTWVAIGGQDSYCGGCHDETPGNTKQDGNGDTTVNIVGDNTTYGFFVTGHGKMSGTYANLSWQSASATGNPAANRACDACHDLSAAHFNSGAMRLKAGYENDTNNSNCKQCHDPGTAAASDPQWYTTYAEYESSAHGAKKCSDCHNVHGSSGNYPAMTKAGQESLCYQCHTEGVIQNSAVSGSGLADDIQQAFGFSDRHNLGTAYSISSNAYTLECVSCHNVHLVTGKYWEADLDKSPVTRVSTPSNPEGNIEIWGDVAGEKMDDFAGTGTYRTPNGDIYSGSQLPDYATFCLDCHGQSGGAPFGIDWVGRPHGRQSANNPNGYGTCPNWYACGKASGWDNDVCTGSQEDCWPVISRGKGDQIWSRGPYNHEERVAGANFTLSCTDCHEAHGSGVRSMIRSNPNNGTGTTIWNTMCNNCHYYYSDWHAGMSCGTASCHVSDSIHRMANYSGSGSTRVVDDSLVLYYAFENNLRDSGSWQVDGKWMDDVAGSYTPGKSGQAAVLSGGMNVQVGTENEYWSTDAGRHGTWIYTHMKYNTTMEAWVYRTDDSANEYIIYSKHTGYGNGDYQFALAKVNGTLRAAFLAQIDNNAGTEGGIAGVRGAYSSVDVPLNKWTHIAAAFNTAGPDRDANDPSVGRIRIYVNGEDVTTSDASGNYMQPGSGETSIYAFPENSGWNEAGVCYNDNWCASEFSVGGFYGWQNEFIGRIDEAKVWNVTKDESYFVSVDSQSPPRISRAEGLIGSTELTITLSEGSYANTGETGDLQVSDFNLTDTNADNPRSISGVTHTAGQATATVTMSKPLIPADVNADTLAAASNSIYDEYNNPADTDSVSIGLSSACPTAPVSIQLNEAPGSSYVMDTQNILYGAVNGAGTLSGTEFSGGGDGSGRYIMFDYNSTCLQADTSMTLEARIKPTGLEGTANYIRRILARDGGGNFQMSVWRNNGWTNYNAPDGEASIALWVYVADNHGGNNWKVVLSNYTGAATGSENECPIVTDHWYLAKAVWNTDKDGGTPGAFFVPADIYIDDLGTDGAGSGENWSGYVNCTDTDQSLKETDAEKLYTGDEINPVDGNVAIGVNRGNTANNLFNGLIDWITWKDSVD